MSLPALTRVQATAELTTIHCGKCGGIYAIAKKYRRHKYERGGFWNCPYCQCSWGYGDSEIKNVKEQLAAKERELESERKRKEWAQQDARIAERRRRALKAVITKTKNRIGHGVCPCCRRNFDNLRRHMATKHPAYKERR